ncbi:FtsX-like permease family protein [Paracoccus aerodenitrificans]|uniref:FtsX-like permease family protein n=1 Tax=Paracoccus aerodenitrificans TaxID=3017781 RepID=UPI0022F0B514|nr:FtsX-like permease family protein [Paracoccus aerodenitrificans]WBU63522.1 FtsX-like permease family protein [Paracoccus aerodenitrificans]
MIPAVLATLWSHWRRNPVQLFTLITGIALATALWTGVQAINAEARASLDNAARITGIAELPRLQRHDGGTIPVEDFVALRRSAVLVSPLVQGDAEIAPGVTVSLTGIDPLTAPSGIWPNANFDTHPTAPDTIFVPPGSASGPGLIESDAVPLGEAVTDIDTAMQLLDRQGYDALILTPPQPLASPDPGTVIPALRRVDPSVPVDPSALTESFRLNLTAFGALCFVVGLFIIRGTTGLAMAQRRRTVTVLRSLGVPSRLVTALMLAELAAIAAISGLLGVVLGYVLATMLMPGVSGTLDGIYGAQVGTGIALRPVWWLGGLAIAILGTLLSASGPMIRGARHSVLSEDRPLRPGILSLAAVILFCFAAALVLWGDGLLAGFGAMGLVLLGTAALMPAFLTGMLHMLRRALRGSLPEWVLAETRAQIPQMSLAMTALLMALSANIGVGTMVDSFRKSFTDFIDQRLAAELYVSTPDGDTTFAAFLPEDTRLLPLRWTDAVIAGQPTEIYGVVDDITYRRDWPLLSGGEESWQAVHAGQGAIINEQLGYRTGLSTGDTISLPDGDARIVGIITDYGNPFGKVYVSDTRLSRIDPDAVAMRYGIRSDDPARIRDDLLAAGVPEDRIGLQDDLKAASIRIFERTFAVTAALNALTLSVAGFAVLTSLLTMTNARLPRLAPLWAMGIHRRQLALLELIRVTLTAAMTALLALPLGIVLSWLLLAVINVEAFGWRLPFRADPVGWLGLMGLGCLAALLAALWPVWRLAHMPPRSLTEIFTVDQ